MDRQDFVKTYELIDEFAKEAAKEKKGADLTQAQRNRLPAKSFAVPRKKAKKLGVEHEIQGEAKGKYPIPDVKHARNALARVAQHGTPGEKAAVEKKVHDKFPGVGNEKTGSIEYLAAGKQGEEMERFYRKLSK